MKLARILLRETPARVRDDGEVGGMGVPLVHDARLTPSEEKSSLGREAF